MPLMNTGRMLPGRGKSGLSRRPYRPSRGSGNPAMPVRFTVIPPPLPSFPRKRESGNARPPFTVIPPPLPSFPRKRESRRY